jgi:hypothetical protein
MNIKLVTDFRDYYDHEFCGSHVTDPDFVYDRRVKTLVSKPQQFKALENLGYSTPTHGTVSEVAKAIVKDAGRFKEVIEESFYFYRVVVYLDLYAHRGEHKVLMHLSEALEKCPDEYCSLYKNDIGRSEHAESFRHLQIGNRAWLLRYLGENSWQSNHAENVHVSVISEVLPLPKLCVPLLGIDLIPFQDKVFACDYNTAPGIKGTGIEDLVSSTEVYRLIKEWYSQI